MTLNYKFTDGKHVGILITYQLTLLNFMYHLSSDAMLFFFEAKANFVFILMGPSIENESNIPIQVLKEIGALLKSASKYRGNLASIDCVYLRMSVFKTLNEQLLCFGRSLISYAHLIKRHTFNKTISFGDLKSFYYSEWMDDEEFINHVSSNKRFMDIWNLKPKNSLIANMREKKTIFYIKKTTQEKTYFYEYYRVMELASRNKLGNYRDDHPKFNNVSYLTATLRIDDTIFL